MCGCVCVCLCDKVTTEGHSKPSPHRQVKPLINVLDSPKDRTEKKRTTPKGRERRRERTREVGGAGDAWVSTYWRSQSSEKGFVCTVCFVFSCCFLPQSVAQRPPPGDPGEKEEQHRVLIPGHCSSIGLFSCTPAWWKSQNINVNLLTDYIDACNIYIILNLQYFLFSHF